MRILKACGLIFLMAVVSGVVNFGAIRYYDAHYATKLAIIDANEYMERVKEKILRQEIGPEEIDLELSRLQRMIASQPQNTVILLSDVVVSKNIEALEP